LSRATRPPIVPRLSDTLSTSERKDRSPVSDAVPSPILRSAAYSSKSGSDGHHGEPVYSLSSPYLRRAACGASGCFTAASPKVALVTSIVEYAAGLEFPEHGHPEGEETLVLDGTFSDQRGDF